MFNYSFLRKIGVTHVLLALLVVAAFFLGIFMTKIQDLQHKLDLAGIAPAGSKTTGQNQGAEPSPKANDIGIGHLPPHGNPDAKVKIVEFGDFRCPFCERFYKDIYPQLVKDYVDAGKAVFYYENYQFLGPASITAGNAAECANEQGKFWDYYDYLYENQPDESDTSIYAVDKLTVIAGQLGLNQDQFKLCLNAKKYDGKIQEDLATGMKVGVQGTPTIFINGISIVGVQPYGTYKTIIDRRLSL